MDLDTLRKKIDSIDEKLLKTLKKRMDVSLEIGRIKNISKDSIEDKKRESEILARLKEKAKRMNVSEKLIVDLFTRILKESRNVQKKGKL